jgi:hypothetical protein
MPWAIMDQAVGLPALNGCFIDGIFFVANHLIYFERSMTEFFHNRDYRENIQLNYDLLCVLCVSASLHLCGKLKSAV